MAENFDLLDDRTWCSDKISTHDCVKMKKNKECGTQKAALKCGRTCGKCTQHELKPNEVCEDKNTNCNKWLKKGAKKVHKCRKNFFAHLCMKSCKHCTVQLAEATEIITTMKTSTTTTKHFNYHI